MLLMFWLRLATVAAGALCVAGCAAHEPLAAKRPDSDVGRPAASNTTAQPIPVDPARDPVNVAAQRELALGMAMEIRVAPGVLELARVGMMQVRRLPRGADVEPARSRDGARAPRPDGNWIIVVAYGNGSVVSRTAISDNGILIAEGNGVVQEGERRLHASLPTPRRVDALELTSTASGETRRIDVKLVMDRYCADVPTARLCQAQ